MDKNYRDELRGVINDTPGEFSFWPTHFAGCVPFVEVYTNDMRLTFQVQEVTRDGPWHTAERAITYARRMATAANNLPLLLDEIERLQKALGEVRTTAESNPCYCAEAHRPGLLCIRCAILATVDATYKEE